MIEEIKSISLSKVLAQLLFIVLPSSLIVFFILWNSNQYFSILKEQWVSQGIYFTLGIVISTIIHQFRVRFLTLFLLLLLALLTIFKGIETISVGEFDSFFLSVQFIVFAYLFSFGWLVGWGLLRVNLFVIVFSGLLLIISLFLISRINDLTIGRVLSYLVPILFYATYIIFTTETIKNAQSDRPAFWWRLAVRLIGFSLLMLLLIGASTWIMYKSLSEKVEEYGGNGKEGENQMLDNQKDGTQKNKESMGMGSRNNRNNNPEPLFCAHIDNYFPDTDIPNPLYLTAYHFTKYDSTTETFERDINTPLNDEFVPNPAQIPLFSTQKDSLKLKNALGIKNRKVIEIEVYKKRLSGDAFVAPSTAFFVQPITVEKDFQKEFKTAYRAKSYVSELNSAYFIYNTDNPMIKAFQEQRFQTLRNAKDYGGVSDSFMKYYTYFPARGVYKPIKDLAVRLAEGKTTTIDKVLAVRDYFLQKDEYGRSIYKYTDNPDIPGLPNASKLNYFMFETKKGYCAYYAGATCFLLRSMNVPCRVVTGFLTIDRSDKNPGWYWFYEDQSHGWVQVYFPEYGWIDFDTTVGNEEAERSPAPDGTPPLEPPRPVMALAGTITGNDTIDKVIDLRATNVVFKDVEYNSLKEQVTLDVSMANIWKDSVQVPLSAIVKGETAMAVSYTEQLKGYTPEKTFEGLKAKLPKRIPIDELYIRTILNEDKEIEKKKDEKIQSVKYYMMVISVSLIILLLFILMLPWLFYSYLKLRSRFSKKVETKVYFTYRASLFMLHQLGEDIRTLPPLRFASYIDSKYDSNYFSFISNYLQLKYSTKELSNVQKEQIKVFMSPFATKVFSSFSWRKRTAKFLNLERFIKYFYIPKSSPDEQNI